MIYNQLTSPCVECPFRSNMAHAFPVEWLHEAAAGAFHCHMTGCLEDGEYVSTKSSHACAGALIFLEKRGEPSQMMRIAERLGVYDWWRLDLKADVR